MVDLVVSACVFRATTKKAPKSAAGELAELTFDDVWEIEDAGDEKTVTVVEREQVVSKFK